MLAIADIGLIRIDLGFIMLVDMGPWHALVVDIGFILGSNPHMPSVSQLCHHGAGDTHGLWGHGASRSAACLECFNTDEQQTNFLKHWGQFSFPMSKSLREHG